MAESIAKSQLKEIFESEQSFASTLMIAMTDDVGSVEWFDWEPEAIRAEIMDRFGAKIPQDNMDKISALILALTTNQFYVSLEAFIGICNSLGGDGADFATFDPADVEEMCWAVTEVLLNDGKQELPLDQVFSEEIKSYIGAQAGHEGFTELPKPLTFAKIDPGYAQATDAMADPDMFTAYFTSGKDKVAQAQAETQDKLQRMAQQIGSIPLKFGDPSSWKAISNTGLTTIGQRQGRAEEGRHHSPSLTS